MTRRATRAIGAIAALTAIGVLPLACDEADQPRERVGCDGGDGGERTSLAYWIKRD